MASRTKFIQPATIARETDVRYGRSSSLAWTSDLSEPQDLPPRTGAMILRKTERGKWPVFHDYGGGNKENYEVGSSVPFSHTAQSDRRDFVYECICSCTSLQFV
jgi:hypothetical protein